MGVWSRVRGAVEGWRGIEAGGAEEQGPGRRTAGLPTVLTPFSLGLASGPGQRAYRSLPKPTPANLRRFAETPVVRRAINVVKDRIASMDWQVRLRREASGRDLPPATERMRALRRCLEEPNESDSFRVLWEQVLEDMLVGGFGAVEMEATGDPERPFRLWPVDGASVQIDATWDGAPSSPRYAQMTGAAGPGGTVRLRDDQLMYLRLNARSHTPFGLGKLEVAFEAVNQFLSAQRYAGRLASNSAAQYALWLPDATPEQHERLTRWWQDEIEGSGRVPVLSSEQKPEVLRFAGGTDADLRLQWQEFLIRMVANAFDLPPMALGLQQDVNRSTASEMADEAFQTAVVPVAKLVAEHISRDLFAKLLGWREFEFRFNDLETRSEAEEVAMQVQLLQAGVLTVEEVRRMRGLCSLSEAPQISENVQAAAGAREARS